MGSLEAVPWSRALRILLLVALAARLAYLVLLDDFIGADEAVGGLMALDIAKGRDFPLLLWEAHYGGVLTSYLGAILFQWFPPSPFVYRLASLPLGLVGVVAVAAAARILWGIGPALAAALWLALGPPLLFAMSSQAVGGYPEVLCFGGLTLWLAARLGREVPNGHHACRTWAVLGAVGGFGTYSLAFVLPLFVGAIWVVRRHRGGLGAREWGSLGYGFFLGFLPFVLYNLAHRGASVVRLAGRVLDVSRAEVGQAPSLLWLGVAKGLGYLWRLTRFPLLVLENVPTFLGLPSWGAWGLIAATAGGVLLAHRAARGVVPRGSSAGFGLALVGWSGLATLLFLWILGLDRARHLFPFYLLASLGLAALWTILARCPRFLKGAGMGLLLLCNVVGTARDARSSGPRVSGLLSALEARGMAFLYTDYFVAYPLIFLSREAVLASPLAGPINVERRPAYTQAVESSPHPGYVFERNTEASAVFVREMQLRGYAFRLEPVAGFDLYIPARHVHPNELNLLRRF